MFFEGIFLEIEVNGVGWRVAESCYIGDEYIKLCPESNSDFICLFTCTLFEDIVSV
jgi:hypothetical protein